MVYALKPLPSYAKLFTLDEDGEKGNGNKDCLEEAQEQWAERTKIADALLGNSDFYDLHSNTQNSLLALSLVGLAKPTELHGILMVIGSGILTESDQERSASKYNAPVKVEKLHVSSVICLPTCVIIFLACDCRNCFP